MKHWWQRLCAVLILALGGSNLVAAADVAIPEPLKPWRDWALHGEEFRRCPLSHGQDGADAADFVCVWYGSLQIDASNSGARFSVPVDVLSGRETVVMLPGSSELWPRELSDGFRSLPVIERNQQPAVLLPPGRTVLQGQIRWRQLPGALPLPNGLALVSLSLNGKPVGQVQRDGDALMLSSDEKRATVQDTLQLRVYQRVQDGIPLLLETVLTINATGSAREVVIGQPLLPGFVPTAMSSKLAARLDEQGQLRLQLRAGEWQLHLYSRAESLPETLTLRTDNGLWPSEEIWSWQSGERLRAASLEGGVPIDPVQADVPSDWQELPALRVRAGESLRISERSRGRQVTDNALQLQRDLWLRFDGSAYSFRDQISGTLRRDWRLDMATPYQLLNVSESGSALPVSSGDNDSLRGVELRTGYLNLNASGELAPDAALSATGWQTRFDSAQVNLHLPPGYRLLAATGVDDAPGSFIERWNLLDTFILVLTAVLIFKLYGVIWSLLVLVAFAWLFHEPEMPNWLLPNAALALLACRYASGKLLTWLQRYRLVSLAALVLILIPFAAGQISALLHPQLESHGSAYGYGHAPGIYDQAMPAAAPAMEMGESAMEDAVATRKSEEMAQREREEEQRIEVTGSRTKRTDAVTSRPEVYRTYADNTISQSGKGIPNWQWHSYTLSWSGPVDPEQNVTLWLLPYTARVLVVLLALAIFAGLFLRIVRELTGAAPLTLAKQQLGFSMWLLPLLFASALLPSPSAQADMPSEQLLNELKTRLTTPPMCAPSCAELANAEVRASREQIELTLDVQALEASAIPVPGRAGEWLPTSVSRDGERSVARQRGNGLQVWVPAGKHRLVLTGPAPGSDRVSLAFALKPRRITVQLDGWEASGLQGDLLPSGSLALTRAASQSPQERATVTQLSVPPFVQVERVLSFADEWRVDTTVTRMAPRIGAFTLPLPLLTGEAVQDDNLKVENGSVQLTFAANDASLRFSSTLARAEQLTLQSPDKAAYVEIWQLAPDNQWRVRTEGTPQIASEDGMDWLQTFAPRPGETLTVNITRPVIVTGATVAIDQLQVHHEQGQRGANGFLQLSYRATQGGEQVLKLPAALEVLRIELDGREQTLRPREGLLTVPVLPGEHRLIISYRDSAEVSWRQGIPAIALGLPAANLSYSVQMPDNRWILYTSGPTLGPAVLYWSALLVFIALAFALARSGLTAVNFRDWLLLGLGLSTVSWWVLTLLVVWLIVLRWREKQQVQSSSGWFNLQQLALLAFSGIAVLTLVGSVPAALLSSPDMMLTGNGSYGNQLNWFADYSNDVLPAVHVISVPMWLYKGAMLLWAIWLSFALLRWIKHAWQALNVGGFWHSKPGKTRLATGGEPDAAATPADNADKPTAS